MDITKSFVSERDRALLGGDYAAYHAQATRRVHHLRRRLGSTTPKGRKYTPKAPVTADNVAHNSQWVHLLLANAERSWASAMEMKSAQSAETTQKPMAGSTKRQIASHLRRAILHADNLATILKDTQTSRAGKIDVLEAQAYLALLKGALAFEKGTWDTCLHHYSLSRLVYSALATTAKLDVYKDLLSNTIDPSIRYAAYQLKIPRTKPVPEIAVQSFPPAEDETKREIEGLDVNAFSVSQGGAEASKQGTNDFPQSIVWRSRQVKLVDATISQMLGLVKEREETLGLKHIAFTKGEIESKVFATAYDDVITARQDAVDATRAAIDELEAEGVDPGDERMQSLQITRTAVNYAVIEWRIGRNRLLIGQDDGLGQDTESTSRKVSTRKTEEQRKRKKEGLGRKLAKLRESVALHDLILRSLDAVKELPGVVGDSTFISELDAKHGYFRALKCIAIGRSHADRGETVNALALYARAAELASEATPSSTTDEKPTDSPPKLDVSSAQVEMLSSHAAMLVTQYRALVELRALSQPKNPDQKVFKPPLAERLHLNQFEEDVDLHNIVNYPPKLQPIPVKPLFFDLAWNYIDYPGRAKKADVVQNGNAEKAKPNVEEKIEDPKPTRKGWFGFGR